MELRTVIGNWIRSVRKESGKSQTELGEELGVTKANVSAWETGRHDPSIAQLVKIAVICRATWPQEICEHLGLTAEALAVARQYQDLLPEKRIEVRSIISTYTMAAKAQDFQASGSAQKQTRHS